MAPVLAGKSGGADNDTALRDTDGKHAVTLSNGVMWNVILNSTATPTATLQYSTDGGATWIYSTDILGWREGSMDAYIDTGGQEYLCFGFRQTGTGGSRTDNSMYYACAKLSSGLTGISSWDFKISVENSNAGYGHIDIVVFPEGSGGALHMTSSFNDGNSRCKHYWVAINSSGVLGTETAVGNAGPWIGAGWPSWPSITYNPSSKGVYITFTAATTADSGFSHPTLGGTQHGGMHRVVANYSAGAWTWLEDLAFDTTQYLTNDDWWCKPLWDSTRSKLMVVGMWYDGSGGKINVLQFPNGTGAADTTVSYTISATANRLAYGNAAIDPFTGDIYLYGFGINGSSEYQPLQVFKWTRATNTLSGPTTLDSTNGKRVYAWYSGGRIHRLYVGTYTAGAPYYTYYDSTRVGLFSRLKSNLIQTNRRRRL